MSEMTIGEFRAEVALVFGSKAMFERGRMVASIGDIHVSWRAGRWRVEHAPGSGPEQHVWADSLVGAVIAMSEQSRRMISDAQATQQALADALGR